MPRPRSKSRDDLISSAMGVFWERGFNATSIEDLVVATRVSRGGIYADFGGKEDLFIACLEAYRARFANPGIDILASGSNGLESIEAYFDYFIALHEIRGMPGPGCFIASTMTELAPHNSEALRIVNEHGSELKSAFATSLMQAASASGKQIAETEISEIAEFLVTSSQGLWSYGKSVSDIRVLKRFKMTLLGLLRFRLGLPAMARK
ncbi:TetR/AcrR family transcriptional regulator [Hyphomonas sp.]|uniref:TetR/AcrR family transcriptional regulator n=1 Tax=Hyphomonas sp. TaxID=87 RepID=UPI003D2CFF23